MMENRTLRRGRRWMGDQEVIGRVVFGAIDDAAFRLKGEFLENRRRSNR